MGLVLRSVICYIQFQDIFHEKDEKGCQASTDTGARTPIIMSGILMKAFWICRHFKLKMNFSFLIMSCCTYFNHIFRGLTVLKLHEVIFQLLKYFLTLT